ncbi:MAG: sugar transferase [Candidatus Omnitrophota bacterium]
MKRIFDLTSALFGLIILSPVFILIALLIKRDSRGPVFFKHTRVGKDGVEFAEYKFRSMVDGAAKMGAGIEIVKDDPRITRFGAFLRKWSIDELPQLINILKGEMSLVGPRPPVPHQVARYSEFEKKRLTVKPGLTGWAQVNGRNLISWKERIKLDVWYIENRSFLLDLKIVWMTVGTVLSRKGLRGADGAVRDYE